MNSAQENPDSLTKVFGLTCMDHYHEYGDFASNVRYYHRLKAKVAERFIFGQAGRSKVFLDAGAGRGPYSKIAFDKYQHVYCYEYDAEELKAAASNVGQQKNITFQQVDLTTIPLPDGFVDTVVCSEVLEHIPDYTKAMAEIYRVMKPGGRMLFSMPNAASLFYKKVRKNNQALLAKDPLTLTHGEWEFLRHLNFNSYSIDAIAQGAGFAIIGRFGANVVPLPYGIRKFLLTNPSFLLHGFVVINTFLSKLFPRKGSFYFLELQK